MSSELNTKAYLSFSDSQEGVHQRHLGVVVQLRENGLSLLDHMFDGL